MESSANDSFGNQNSGGSGGSLGTSTASTGFSHEVQDDARGVSDRARSAASAAGDKLADVGSTVRDKAGNLKTTIADALQSGAERLRQQAASNAQVAGAGAEGGTSIIADDNRLAQTSNQLAGGMQGAADWLRDADLDGLKSGIERQVKEHPGRSLAVAVGLGYLLGKALRR